MQQLLQQLQVLMDECWKPCVKERLAALLRALHSARPAVVGVYKALSEAVGESLEEYTDQHGPCNHMKASVNQAVRRGPLRVTALACTRPRRQRHPRSHTCVRTLL